MNYLIITMLLIILLVIAVICKFHSEKDENFDYAMFYNSLPRRRYYNRQKSAINPGFGDRMWGLESAPEWNDYDYDIYAKDPQPGDFGELVSYLEDRNDATAIKNLPV